MIFICISFHQRTSQTTRRDATTSGAHGAAADDAATAPKSPPRSGASGRDVAGRSSAASRAATRTAGVRVMAGPCTVLTSGNLRSFVGNLSVIGSGVGDPVSWFLFLVRFFFVLGERMRNGSSECWYLLFIPGSNRAGLNSFF